MYKIYLLSESVSGGPLKRNREKKAVAHVSKILQNFWLILVFQTRQINHYSNIPDPFLNSSELILFYGANAISVIKKKY